MLIRSVLHIGSNSSITSVQVQYESDVRSADMTTEFSFLRFHVSHFQRPRVVMSTAQAPRQTAVYESPDKLSIDYIWSHIVSNSRDGQADAGNRIWCILDLKCDI